MSSRARSSASARRTSSSPNFGDSANCEHPVDGAARAHGDLGGDRHFVLQVAERVAQVLQRDLLHVPAFGALASRDEFLVGVLAAQSMPHYTVRAHHDTAL